MVKVEEAGMGVMVGQTYMVKRADSQWCLAEVLHIQRRTDGSGSKFEFYVHSSELITARH